MIGGGSTILLGITIGQRSFIAAGAVVTKDVPQRSLVVGVPGTIRALPEELDRSIDETLVIQPLDIWHPGGPKPQANLRPEDWSEPWKTV